MVTRNSNVMGSITIQNNRLPHESGNVNGDSYSSGCPETLAEMLAKGIMEMFMENLMEILTETIAEMLAEILLEC